jgi:hypothetical protein
VKVGRVLGITFIYRYSSNVSTKTPTVLNVDFHILFTALFLAVLVFQLALLAYAKICIGLLMTVFCIGNTVKPLVALKINILYDTSF